MSRGRSQRNVAATTTNITTPVRDTVEATPTPKTSAHREPTTLTNAGARGSSPSGASITRAALKAIGCWAEANTRSLAVPTR